MAPHQERVVTEKRELDEKLGKLETFLSSELYGQLDTAERGRLRMQHHAMSVYSMVLGQRITAF